MLFYKIFDKTGISIIGVSFAVTLLCLPIYIIAEKWQQTERNTVKKLKEKISKIKAVFKGDEQFFILSTLYRQNHYHPVFALRNSFGILIQIPFFIAAYTFIAHLDSLHNASFLFIKDLSSPDGILEFGNIKVNILPVLMTLINISAGIIYTRELSVRDKLQVYGIAVIFLALLYNSPSGLVLYWTMNNILSLIKNIFYKLKNPAKILYFIATLFIIVFILYLFFINKGALKKRLLLICVFSLFFFLPLLKKPCHFFLKSLTLHDRRRNLIFFLNCGIIVLLTGVFIPAAAIASAPEEFSFIDSYSSPLPFIYNSFLQSLGLFFFWPSCIYLLFNNKIKLIMTFVFSTIMVFALVNVFILKGSYSTLSNIFNFDSLSGITSSLAFNILSIIIYIFLIFLVFLFLKIKKGEIHKSGLIIIAFSLTALCFYNIGKIYSVYNTLLSLQNNDIESPDAISPVFSLSKDKPNLIIIMSDCAINGFVKPIFKEHPKLLEQFDGFTLYPNTVSFAVHTLMGAPPIWGGYEYTPLEMNKKDSVPLVEKHNEALLVLPKLLVNAGYEVTITDPSWANYASINDTSIYDEYEHMTAFNTIGRYTGLWYSQNKSLNNNFTSSKILRNALWFSFLRIAPPFLRITIYDDGWYWGNEAFVNSITKFINSYAVLDFLPRLTSYDSAKPSALLITNEATHDLALLEYPDYIPVQTVSNFGEGSYARDRFYHVNNAFYLKTGEWLDELKRNNCYDNTRIIIVSDHGSVHVNANLSDTDIPIPNERRESYNPVLMVKDFNAHGELSTDMTFMTNADVPVLALDGIAEPVNPFTSNSLINESKKDGVFITVNHLPQAYQHNKTTFKIDKNQWIFIRDNIFDENNWVLTEK
jgi:YidC/Oxa1 family membrane protein insertase